MGGVNQGNLIFNVQHLPTSSRSNCGHEYSHSAKYRISPTYVSFRQVAREPEIHDMIFYGSILMISSIQHRQLFASFRRLGEGMSNSVYDGPPAISR